MAQQQQRVEVELARRRAARLACAVRALAVLAAADAAAADALAAAAAALPRPIKTTNAGADGLAGTQLRNRQLCTQYKYLIVETAVQAHR